MRAREFIVEYNQQKTAQMFGKQIANTFNNGPDKRFIVDPNVIKDDDSIINYVLGILEDADPTPNKIYMPWLAREYARGQIKRIEDADAYKPLLQIYEIDKKRRDFRQDAKDIMRLNATQFYTILKNYELPQAPMKDRGQAREVYKDSTVRVIVPVDQQAACYYGQGTRWCTAATQGTNYFDRYNSRGKLYILLPQQPEHEGEKYQLHFGTDQYMDEEDDPVRIEYILKERFPELLSFFKEIEPKLSHYVVFADDKLLRSIEKIS